MEIPLFKVNMPEGVVGPLQQVLLSGYIGQGPKVAEFEKALEPWVGSRNVLALNSCTSALHLALRLAGVGPGDEVISTPMTCTATNMPVLERGATLVWADIDPNTGCIDPELLRNRISSRTKAIICVHWAGYPCNLQEINDLAKKFDLKVIEDAAHAFGAMYKGSQIGSHSDFVCFSFQAIKHMTTVDGGILVCRSEEDYRRGKLLRWYGIDRDSPRTLCRCEDDIPEYGYKFHMNDVNATIGLVQLQSIQNILDRYRRNAAVYDDAFRFLKGVALPEYAQDRVSSYWVYPLLLRDKQAFAAKMAEKGIVVSMVHKRNDVHTAFQSARTGPLPGVDMFEKCHLALPVGWWLTDADLQYIIEAVREYSREL